MVVVGKNEGAVVVQVKDQDTKLSKSFTIHNSDYIRLFNQLLWFSKQLNDYDEIRLVCIKKEEKK